jgi:hypothetical protein
VSSSKSLAEWVEELRSEDETVRVEARLRLIRRGGPRAVEAFAAAMRDDRDYVRTHALQGLVRVRGGNEVLLAHLNDDPCGMVRVLAAAFVQADSPRVVEGLISALRDPWEEVVCTACVRLAQIGDTRCVEQLRSLLTHQTWKVRRDACEALCVLGAVDAQLLSAAEDLDRTWEANHHNIAVGRSRQVDASLGLAVRAGVDLTTTELVAAVREFLEERRRAAEH